MLLGSGDDEVQLISYPPLLMVTSKMVIGMMMYEDNADAKTKTQLISSASPESLLLWKSLVWQPLIQEVQVAMIAFVIQHNPKENHYITCF